jgi:hypothetical protein
MIRETSLALARYVALAGFILFPLRAQELAAAEPRGVLQPGMGAMNPAGMLVMDLGSGTSLSPAAAPMPMIVTHHAQWTASFMGTGFLVDTQQSGPRGGDKLYAPNWFMGSLQHPAGAKATFQAELMLSLDPATITNRKYPLVFQTGETAYGQSIADGQHPHNFVMELGFHYAYQLTATTFLDLYTAPVGDPALGPEAFPHRASAAELPQATLSHHLQDSTHVAADVITLGIARRTFLGKFKLEASGFHGGELARIVGPSSRAPWIHGPRVPGICPHRNGPRKFLWGASLILNRWSQETRSARRRRCIMQGK